MIGNNSIVPKENEPLIKKWRTVYDPSDVLKRVEKELRMKEMMENAPDSDGEIELSEETMQDINVAMTTAEFTNGSLLVQSIPELYRTFGIDTMRKIQGDFSCETTSEKATAEVATLSFIRILEMQNRMTGMLERTDGLTKLDMQYISIIGKELDRANRHYLNAIQVLKMMKKPPFSINVKTTTAIFGNNQAIQENQNVTPK